MDEPISEPLSCLSQVKASMPDAEEQYQTLQSMAEGIARKFLWRMGDKRHRQSGWLWCFADDFKQVALLALWKVVMCSRIRRVARDLRCYAAGAIRNALKDEWRSMNRYLKRECDSAKKPDRSVRSGLSLI